MTDQINTQVQGEPNSAVATTPATPTDPGQVANATLPTSPADAESVEKLRLDLQKYEQDIRNMKSTFQKRENELTRTWTEREQTLKSQLDEARLASMDEEARKTYLAQKEMSRFQELETKAQEAERIRGEYDASLKAIEYFTALGVPLSSLNLGNGYDALFNSGFEFVTREFKNRATAPATSNPVPPLPPVAPPVTTTTGTAPNLKPTWLDLEKTYGSREAVYRLVETGRLSPTIIPTT